MTSTRPGTRPDAPQSPGDDSRGTPVPGAWLHLLCCGAPLLIILVIAVGVSALIWVAIPAGIAAVIVAAVLVARRRRSGDWNCCAPQDNVTTTKGAGARGTDPAQHTSGDQVPADRWTR